MNPLLTFTAIYAAITASLYGLSNVLTAKPQQYTSFVARTLASIGALVICATYGVFASIALRIVGKAGLSQWTVARSFKHTMWWFTGIWFDVVEGKEYLETRPAVFVGNHQTELDILFLGTVFPKYCSVTAKKSLKWSPFLGQFMALSKTVFIDRANRATAVAAFDSAAKHMHSERQSVYIFPEGTRSYYDKPDMLPFKKGAFHLAIQAQVPIVPIVVANYSNVLNIRRKIFWAGRIPIKVLPPVETKGLESKDADELCARVREMMLKALILITEEERRSASKELTPKSANETAAKAIASGIDMHGNGVANSM